MLGGETMMHSLGPSFSAALCAALLAVGCARRSPIENETQREPPQTATDASPSPSPGRKVTPPASAYVERDAWPTPDGARVLVQAGPRAAWLDTKTSRVLEAWSSPILDATLRKRHRGERKPDPAVLGTSPLREQLARHIGALASTARRYDGRVAVRADGSRAVLAVGADLLVAERDGTIAGLLVADAASPSISPDGRSVAFIRASTAGRNTIGVAAVEPSARVRDLPGLFDAEQPRWSPDGRFILGKARVAESTHCLIRVNAAEAGAIEKLACEDGDANDVLVHEVTTSSDAAFAAFVVERLASARVRLRVFDVNAGKTVFDEVVPRFQRTTVGADGRVFGVAGVSSQDAGMRTELVDVDVRTKRVRTVPSSFAWSFGATFVPESAHIALVSRDVTIDAPWDDWSRAVHVEVHPLDGETGLFAGHDR